jgi:O-acetylserine/cysteine efflux transporter
MALAATTSVIWGLAFLATKLGLESFSPPQLTLLRFVVAALPVLVLPRPVVPWTTLVLTGLTLFAGQFLLLFFAFAEGMPPGLASVTQQMQVFFTVGLAALFLGDVPTRRQTTGMAVAFCGIGAVALTAGGSLPLLGLALALGGALSWAVGNVLVKRIGPGVPALPLVVWLSLVPPLPALLVAQLGSAGPSLTQAVAGASWASLLAVLYLGTISTVLGFAAWGSLLARYPAALVAPFALLSPCTGVVASALVFGERFGAVRLGGMALILAGLAVTVLPAPRRVARPA